MLYAFVSDIHANRQAWDSVVADIRSRQVDVILCLGDIVGYGPRPVAVFESVCERCDGIILGNHDAVVGGRCDPEIFNDNARSVIEWTQRKLGTDAQAMFADMHIVLEGDDFVAVHADIVEPDMFWYIENQEDAQINFEGFVDPLMFVGHTHNAGIFIRDEESGIIAWHAPVDFEVDSAQRYIVNVGSVGDPRNPNDIDACYVTYDTDRRSVFYHRVPFDIDGYRQDLSSSGLHIAPAFLQRARSRTGSGATAPEVTNVSIASEVSTAPRRPRAIVSSDTPNVIARNQIAMRFEQKRREAMEIQKLAESLGVVERQEMHRLDVRQLKRESQPLSFAAIMATKRKHWEIQKEQEARENAAKAKLLMQRKLELQRSIEEQSRKREALEAKRRERTEQERQLMRAALQKRKKAAQEQQGKPAPSRRPQAPVGSGAMRRSPPAAATPAATADSTDKPMSEEALRRKQALQERIASRQRERAALREQQRERTRQALARKQAQKDLD
jgi:predicted phosphodiesterase